MCLRFQFCTHQRVCIVYFLKKGQIRCTLLHSLSSGKRFNLAGSGTTPRPSSRVFIQGNCCRKPFGCGVVLRDYKYCLSLGEGCAMCTTANSSQNQTLNISKSSHTANKETVRSQYKCLVPK